MPSAAPAFEAVRDSGLFGRLAGRGMLIGHMQVEASELGAEGRGAKYVLEHPCLPFVSNPYEWTFAALKAAALLQLDLLLEVLADGFTLIDASAYNIQFCGAEPVFIDTLSFRPYEPGSYWLGHRQFCEQFLNPLLLRSKLGLDYHAWYRGSSAGIPAADLARLFPRGRKLRPKVLWPGSVRARRQAGRGAGGRAPAAVAGRDLPPRAFANILRGLRLWIEGLEPAARERTAFGDYADDNSYSGQGVEAKEAFVTGFAAATRPGVLLDLGCNTGRFSEVALAAGFVCVLGVGSDLGVLGRAYARVGHGGLPLLSLRIDLSDPSPDQGWQQAERACLARRSAESCDALLALALVHHLAIAGNVPLAGIVDWLVSLAPRGVVEFVPKSDPMVQGLLALREDVFPEYGQAAFEQALAGRAEIVAQAGVSGGDRRLYHFERR